VPQPATLPRACSIKCKISAYFSILDNGRYFVKQCCTPNLYVKRTATTSRRFGLDQTVVSSCICIKNVFSKKQKQNIRENKEYNNSNHKPSKSEQLLLLL
jgi:hypothetical protein